MHGFARIAEWRLTAAQQEAEGSVVLALGGIAAAARAADIRTVTKNGSASALASSSIFAIRSSGNAS